MEIERLAVALRQSWSAETAYGGVEWTADNPARGQCVVSSLVVQDYLGGDLVRFAVEGEDLREKHYANVMDGVLVDVTRGQYEGMGVTMKEHRPERGTFDSLRERVLADEDTARRYELLKKRVEEAFV